jgi:hypothetical protein
MGCGELQRALLPCNVVRYWTDCTIQYLQILDCTVRLSNRTEYLRPDI